MASQIFYDPIFNAMPSNQIFFSHNNKDVSAELYYNFEDFSDILLVVPNIESKDLKEIIPFIRNDDHWETTSPVKFMYPQTVKNIIEELNVRFQD